MRRTAPREAAPGRQRSAALQPPLSWLARPVPAREVVHVHVRQAIGRRTYLELAQRAGATSSSASSMATAQSFWRCVTCGGFGGSAVAGRPG